MPSWFYFECKNPGLTLTKARGVPWPNNSRILRTFTENRQYKKSETSADPQNQRNFEMMSLFWLFQCQTAFQELKLSPLLSSMQLSYYEGFAQSSFFFL